MAPDQHGMSKPGKAGQGKAGPGKAGRPRHYGIERWVDFARGLARESEAMKMTSHAAGCMECRDLMNFCEKVAATARRMASQRARTNSGTA